MQALELVSFHHRRRLFISSARERNSAFCYSTMAGGKQKEKKERVPGVYTCSLNGALSPLVSI